MKKLKKIKIEKGHYLTAGKCVVEITEIDLSAEVFVYFGVIIYLNKGTKEESLLDHVGDDVSFAFGGYEYEDENGWLDLEEKITIETHPEYFI